ncbi:hypothetical protein RIN65_16830 [Pantoea agglomerans]|uniref:hypothetical protein n=1 Tax=Enterobacter agglomerans TaxID=549 RepID=UPI0028C378FE|nr:hypothetical protein [Pantoea agglomerans]WNN34169.1 hypothetical protein RIN65_16830 [Pantoea agglomerans]
MNSQVFTVHQPFTVYLIENKGKSVSVNSMNSFHKKSFLCSGWDPNNGSKPRMKFLYFSLYTNMLKVKQLQWKCGGTIGGTSKFAFKIFVISHLVDGGFESGLRHQVWKLKSLKGGFFCVWDLCFQSLNQPASIPIRQWMQAELVVYPVSIRFYLHMARKNIHHSPGYVKARTAKPEMSRIHNN